MTSIDRCDGSAIAKHNAQMHLSIAFLVTMHQLLVSRDLNYC
ncbi:hypothetical protein [Nostoc sp. DedQUE09]|nr:hypothetical protein [Nostoc sp. DedQUE09]MDZ7956137.1 hypothetical protein [Nostoc sp. DedQUE09]